MKRLIIASLFLLGLFAVAMAGDYHFGTTLICSDCHVMHHSQQHGYNQEGGGIVPPMGSAPESYLLRDEVNKLCLNCHDGQGWAPDVYGNNSTANTRQAGALNKEGISGNYNPADGHTLNSKATAPGGTWAADTSEGLECVNCHQQHGRASTGQPSNGQYRNRVTNPGGTSSKYVTYAVGTNDLTRAVYERSGAGAAVADHYDISNVDFNEPNTAGSPYGEWCQGCHTNFHGSSADANMRDQGHSPGEGWVRHPTADVNIGALGGGHSRLTTFGGHLYRVKVMSANGDWGTQGTAWASAPSDLTPSCFSCHKGHGNKNAFGLIYAKGNAALGEEGDGSGADAQVRTLCKQCHGQGAYATP
jgi:hypothetical protein